MDINTKPTISTFTIFAGGYHTFTAIRRKVIPMALCAFFAPQILSMAWLSYFTKLSVEQMKSLVDNNLAKQIPSHYQTLLEASAEFFSPYLVGVFCMSCIFFAAYMGITKLAIAYHLKEKIPSATSAFLWGLRQFFPRGILFILTMILLNFERHLWGPFRIFTMLALMAPVLYIAEGRKLSSSLFNALFLKYTHPATGTAFNVAFSLVIFGAFLFFIEMLVAWTGESILSADEWLGLTRSFWDIKMLNQPYTLVYFLQKNLSSLAYAALITLIPFFTVNLYFSVSPKLSQKI